VTEEVEVDLPVEVVIEEDEVVPEDEEHLEAVVVDEVGSPDSVDEDQVLSPLNPTSTPVSTSPRARNTCLLPET